MDITERLKEIIKQETNTDIEIRTRKRETIEMRSLYCTVLKQLKPKKTLQAIGDTIELNHATVINSLNNYKVYEQYNPELKKFKTTILSYFTMDDSELKELLEIEKLKHKVMELKIENDSLRIQLHKLNEIKTQIYEYKIIDELNTLMTNTKDTIQHTLIKDRLEAFYTMNKNIKL